MATGTELEKVVKEWAEAVDECRRTRNSEDRERASDGSNEKLIECCIAATQARERALIAELLIFQWAGVVE